MADGDRSRDQHPDNVIFWRLAALEEAMKYQSGQLAELRNRVDRQPEQLAREYAPRLELEREYIKREDLREVGSDRRETWTLRVLSLGVMFNGLGIIALFVSHHT